jgi:hypothetical protein
VRATLCIARLRRRRAGARPTKPADDDDEAAAAARWRWPSTWPMPTPAERPRLQTGGLSAVASGRQRSRQRRTAHGPQVARRLRHALAAGR